MPSVWIASQASQPCGLSNGIFTILIVDLFLNSCSILSTAIFPGSSLSAQRNTVLPNSGVKSLLSTAFAPPCHVVTTYSEKTFCNESTHFSPSTTITGRLGLFPNLSKLYNGLGSGYPLAFQETFFVGNLLNVHGIIVFPPEVFSYRQTTNSMLPAMSRYL